MSKIEDALNLVKDVGGVVGNTGIAKNRSLHTSYFRRRPAENNLGADWIAGLNSLETSAPNNPESRVILGEQHDERTISAYKMLRTRTLQRMRRMTGTLSV